METRPIELDVKLPEGLRLEAGRLVGSDEAMRSLRGLIGRALQGPGSVARIPDEQRCKCRRYSKWLAKKRRHVCPVPAE